jgi:hypothetical protein
MKKVSIILAGFLLITSTGCKKFLDVNENPNGPAQADPALYMPSIQTGLATAIQFDSRGIGPYTQNFLNSAADAAWDRQGYTRSSDFGGELWRNVYWKSGQNTIDLINVATEEKKWDQVGIGKAMQAWGWQMLTDYHGPVILKQAFDPARNTFDYDEQDTVYAFVKRLSMEAIAMLEEEKDAIGSPLLQKFDLIYKGNRSQWKKFVYGVLAINAHHLIKKPTYNPDEVINYVDKSLASNADDALVPFAGTNSTDANFYGTLRGNMGVFGQSAFIVRLTDGTVFGGAQDPRQPIMLNPSTDGTYRGLTAGSGQTSTVSGSASGVRSLWGTTLGVNTVALGTPGKYLFQDKAPFPLMTYSMLQFIKAEAAFIKGDKATALDAYKKGINAHLDFVRQGTKGPGSNLGGGNFTFVTDPVATAAFDTQRAVYLANPAVIPASEADLTINQILLQKYIALWGYGYIETWTDLRKHDYSSSVFTTFSVPTTLFADNAGKLAYRVRPRYNSEYIWNIDALKSIGGFDLDYHTRKTWIFNP